MFIFHLQMQHVFSSNWILFDTIEKYAISQERREKIFTKTKKNIFLLVGAMEAVTFILLHKSCFTWIWFFFFSKNENRLINILPWGNVPTHTTCVILEKISEQAKQHRFIPSTGTFVPKTKRIKFSWNLDSIYQYHFLHR